MTTNITPQNDSVSLLPQRAVKGPDENGIKTVIEYKLNQKGEKVKVTTTFRVRKVVLKNRKDEKKLWPKFGDAVEDAIANQRLTMVSTEEVFLERSNVKDSVIKGSDEMKNEGDFPVQFHQNRGAPRNILCRICQGHHWTAKCPYKVLQTFRYDSTYIPQSQRCSLQRMINSDASHGSSENLVRVSNFSRDANEDDLRDLFIPFGALTSARIAIDPYTGLSRGFGFVRFVKTNDAQRAIDSLHRYGIDNLILHVEWFDYSKW